MYLREDSGDHDAMLPMSLLTASARKMIGLHDRTHGPEKLFV